MELTGLLIFSVLVEAIVTTIRWVVEEEFTWFKVAALVISVLVCVAYGVDFLAELGFSSSVPFVGSVLTGVVVSRGSNFFFDLVSALKNR